MTPAHRIEVVLVDKSSTRIAVLQVAPIGDLYRGTICLDAMPAQLQRLFEEFEESVEGQMFSLADEIEEKINAMSLRVEFANGMESYVEDLQVFPSTKRISFKTRQTSTVER
jgi:hypothetical protein